jgi:site-specific DNA-methyltransferase (adenine-specific)
MPQFPDKSIDMILCDLPYGTTACKWDIKISLDLLWLQYQRLIKMGGVICLFGSQPFTTELISSNLIWFKYCWYWKKTKANGWQHSKNKPMSCIEEICVFSSGSMGHAKQLGNRRMTYFPQGVVESTKKVVKSYWHGKTMGKRPNQVGKEYQSYTGFPSNFLEYSNVHGSDAIHGTQKPVDLCEYLIKTYTNEGDLVLDNCAGSGTTAIAAINTNRNYILIEKELNYFDIVTQRINSHTKEIPQ